MSPPSRGERDRLVLSTMPVAQAIAARYSRCGVPVADLVQEAMVGALRALDRYRPELGAFGAYARSWMRSAVLASIARSTIVVPPDLALEIARAERDLPGASTLDLAERVRESMTRRGRSRRPTETQVASALTARRTAHTLGLDSDASTLECSSSFDAERARNATAVSELLASVLTLRERQVLTAVHGITPGSPFGL